MLIVALLNFNVLITGSTDALLDAKAVILPVIVIVAGAAGTVLGLILKAKNPTLYARIGEGGSHD